MNERAKKMVGALVGVVLGAGFILLCPDVGLSVQGVRCLGILLGAIVWWVCGVLPEYAIGFVMVVLFAVVAGVPTSTALSGFASETWWLLVGAFGLGAGMKLSGLMERMARAIVRTFPNAFSAQVAGLVVASSLVGPLVPSLSAKVTMLEPIAQSIGDALGYKRFGKPMQGLFLAVFTSVRSIGLLAISASIVGYAFLATFPADVQAQFDMLHWAIAALPWFVVATVLNYIALVALYRPRPESGDVDADASAGAAPDVALKKDEVASNYAADESPASDHDDVEAGVAAQASPAAGVESGATAEVPLFATAASGATAEVPQAATAAPGTADEVPPATAVEAPRAARADNKRSPMSRHEKQMCAIILTAVALWATQPLHGIGPHIVALAGFACVVACGILGKRGMREAISWEALVFIGMMFGLSPVFAGAGIQDWLVQVASPAFTVLVSNPYLFVLGIGLLTVAMRFLIVSEVAYLNILMPFLVPLALDAGVSPWVVAFAMYACISPWFGIYQNSVYLPAYYSVDGKMARHADLAKYCFVYLAICLLGLVVSVPYWQWMGLM